MSDEENGNEKEESRESLLSAVISLVILIIIVLGFKSSILDANNIPTGSMIPTLKIGDYLFVNKMRYSIRLPFTNWELYRLDDPKRGDIVTFIPPDDPGKHYVKRVMGVPGDRIRITQVSACDLPSSKANKRLYPEPGQTDSGKPFQEFSCNSSLKAGNIPIVAFVEYQLNGKGPWLNYSPEILSAEETRQILTDSDNSKVLHPSLRPMEERNAYRIHDELLPVLLRETVSGFTHYTVENYNQAEPGTQLCNTIKESKGCLIPPNRYWMMGDNRDDSKDSRMLPGGAIARDKIHGKAFIIYFSINWHDEICQSYVRNQPGNRGKDWGFKLENFPPEEQWKYCSRLDLGQESRGQYLNRTLFYRIPRMYVRWRRLATLLK